MTQINKVLIAVLIVLAVFFPENKSYGFSVIVPVTPNSNVQNNLSTKYLNAAEFVKLSAHDFSKLTGKKLNLFQRVSFQIAKLRLKHDLKKNPDLKITDYHKGSEKAGRFNFLWFIIGLAAPIFGLFTGSLILFLIIALAPVATAYITRQDKVIKKSVWLGFGTGILLIFLLLLLFVIAYAGWK
ncbi:MAG: hypothetical protein KGM16_03250 [Bacteroidota bacterium]|nr:hypothetical protein [Bacteroidota bacterium]